MESTTLLGWGSGIYIGNGYFLTAAHVAKGELSTNTLKVVTDHGKSIMVKPVFINGVYDFALVRAINLNETKDIPTAKLNCGPTFVGEHVTFHGNIDQIDFMQTQGFIMAGPQSAYGDAWPIVIPVEGMIIWGMSGGATVNDNNEVVGINIAIYQSNGVIFPAGFIVPVSLACNELNFKNIAFN